MAAPAFTVSSTTASADLGECTVEIVTTAGSRASSGSPTQGQLWPRGNP